MLCLRLDSMSQEYSSCMGISVTDEAHLIDIIHDEILAF